MTQKNTPLIMAQNYVSELLNPIGGPLTPRDETNFGWHDLSKSQNELYDIGTKFLLP